MDAQRRAGPGVGWTTWETKSGAFNTGTQFFPVGNE